jgi:hypothetical protein
MTARKKTVCVGRYLVDVPVQAEVELSGGMLDGFDIATVEESEAAFRSRLAEREVELRAREADVAANTDGGIAEARDSRIAGMVGRTYIYARSSGYMMDGDRRVYLQSVSVESHAHKNGVSFSLTARSAEEASASEAEALLARIRPLALNEIPAEPGFCVPRGVFVDPLPVHHGEHMLMHLTLPDHADLGITFASFAGMRPGPGLLARTAETDATIGADVLLRMTKLRTGKRSINGVDGEELLLRAREFNFATTYGFSWEAAGKPDDPTLPFLSIELRTGSSERPGGRPVDSGLCQDALFALWNSITSSIRPRVNERKAVAATDRNES